MSLLALPNELLVAVFENPKFPVEFLCILALSCRRLHYVALPIYFARKGMPYPSKSAVITLRQDGRDMLAALNMALFISSMEDLTVVFPHPSCVSIYPLLPYLQRVRKFVSRFPSLNSVTLQLDVQTSACNTTGDDAALRAWAAALGELLNAVVGRCTDLTVKYGGYLAHSYTLSIENYRGLKRVVESLRRLLAPPRPVLAGRGWAFRRAREQGRQSVSIKSSRARTRITALHIQSALLVLPPGLCWTISVLRSSPITSLSISQISLEKPLWNAALTLLAKAAGPTLTSLTLSELEFISDVEIFEFCARLPRLTTLKIGPNEETRGTPTNYANGTVPEFLHLTALEAPATFVLHFLRSRPTSPKLRSLCIAFPTQGSRDIRTIAARLVAIGEALLPRRTYPRPRVSLSLSLFSDAIQSDLDALRKLPAEYKRSLGLVDGLDLRVLPYDAEDVALWVRMFPSPSRVSMAVHSKAADGEVDAERFFHALSKDQSLLRTVAINGTTRILEHDHEDE